jgi:N-methylhydantoinase A
LAPSAVSRLAHGTTVGTNALIQRRVGRVGLITTKGFRDLLRIGRQTRPRVYDVHLDHPEPIVARELRLEVNERTLADGRHYRELDETGLAEAARELDRADVDTIVIGFLNAYAYPEHEQRAQALVRQTVSPNIDVLTSSEIFPEFREFERFSTAVLNAALITVMNDYLNRFSVGAKALDIPAPASVSQSVGGLMSLEMARRIPLKASLSGPAAGVIGIAERARHTGLDKVVTLDMGGTSADVSLLVDGRPAEVQDRELAGFPLRMPALDVNAVGAGGGSLAWVDRDGLLKVGPRSAGAVPGPACYALGGEQPTVTDANVYLGRLNRESLLDGSMPIDANLASKAIGELAESIGLPEQDTALGIIQVTTAVMVKAIRAISLERGHNPSDFCLVAFGGAGPLHATDVARDLDISTVCIPPSPGILCAEGLLHSDLRSDFVRPLLLALDLHNLEPIEACRASVADLARGWFEAEQIADSRRELTYSIDMRYVGQNFELTLDWADQAFTPDNLAQLSARFHDAHEQAYGFSSSNEPIELVCIRAQAFGILDKPAPIALEPRESGSPSASRTVLFGNSGWHDTPVYRRESLGVDQVLTGPAIVEQMDTTIVVHPGDALRIDNAGNLMIQLNDEA